MKRPVNCVLVAEQGDGARYMRLHTMTRDFPAAAAAGADGRRLNGQRSHAESTVVERELKMRTAHGALSHGSPPLPTEEHICIK
jgi:hypothetical protein